MIPSDAGSATGRRPGRDGPDLPRQRAAPPGRKPSKPRKPLTERQRRLRQRALPLGVLAFAAFVFGAISAAGSAEQDMATRFVEAWARQDFNSMHDELTPEAQAQYPVEQLAGDYQQAQNAATARAIDPGDAKEPTTVDGTDVVEVDLDVRTETFGLIEGSLLLPVSDGKIAWAPHLTFPNLQEGERVGRRLTLGRRAAILAKDGKTPLAQGNQDRSSPLGGSAIDVAGEVGEPDAERAAELAESGYPSDQPTGVSGLELAFNDRLAGRPGGELLAVPEGTDLPDVPGGVEGRVLATAEQQPGQPVRTTIDPDLQEVTVGALAGQGGGIAVLDARNGQVRAIAGQAVSLLRPPGSTFKVITTTAALEDDKVKLEDTFPVVTEINPAPDTGARVISNAHGEPCGGDFLTTFADSCNTVFAPLGVKVGAEKLVDTAERYGFNQKPTLYDAEATEAVDPPAMEMPDEFDETGTELSVSAIGQGQVLANALGMASVAQTVANGGTRSPTPIVTDPELQSETGPVRVTSKENARVLNGLMRAVVTQGTGSAAALPNVQVAGKTGTAEIGPRPGVAAPPPGSADEQELIVDAWFIAFAPARKPKLAVAVTITDASGDGGTVAAPIAREIFAAALG
ncbi:MAG TPA: penicillin-binding transpeptidase domain-containing protein [Solirubrobacterales bacterium]|nr:penicillin-binding transpeptidase domain-containing protein [Solirubrobacterales bacterium]